MHTAPREQRRTLFRYLLLFSAVSGIAALASWPMAARGNNICSTFPNYCGGILFMSAREGYAGGPYITSSHCNAGETTAFANIASSTNSKPEMRAKWPSGIRMQEYRCDGVWDNYADIQIKYLPQSNFLQSDGSHIGGRNVNVAASSAYCSFWSTSAPCGNRPTVQINQDKFFDPNRSASYRESEIEHETGHALGLQHHCTGPAVMNNGAQGCPDGYQGDFGSAPGYFATDRQGINNVYP
jgi:hypothetical protein